ncbi:MAG: large conductance mechanosensitive channel protein MscL [Bacilli bacterium]|nr:large conductance mechanosensitive channel protein MscL [Bacilli bacterium]
MSSKEEVKKVKESGSKFINEFKTFILRGNVMDLAVGVLIGAAFQNLVTSLTTNIISPILGCFSEVDFNQFVLRIGKLELTYGAFITDVINFVIMAFVIFLIVKFMNFLQNVGKKPEPPKPEVKEKPAKPEDIQLLEEIRDLLKNSDVKETKKKETKKKK